MCRGVAAFYKYFWSHLLSYQLQSAEQKVSISRVCGTMPFTVKGKTFFLSINVFNSHLSTVALAVTITKQPLYYPLSCTHRLVSFQILHLRPSPGGCLHLQPAGSTPDEPPLQPRQTLPTHLPGEKGAGAASTTLVRGVLLGEVPMPL